MSYYTTLQATEFPSDLSQEEIDKLWEEFRTLHNIDMQEFFLEEYIFTKDNNGTTYLEMDDYFGNHYNLDLIAEFIQKLLPEKCMTHVNLITTHDFDGSGYRIRKNRIVKLSSYITWRETE